jgi:hypothetical protein
MELLIVALVVGALLPIVVALSIVLIGVAKTPNGNWGMVTAFGKGICLGAAGGLTVAAITVALVLALAWLLG